MNGPASAERSVSRTPLLIALGLALLVLAVYQGSGSHGFVDFDDDDYVYTNPHVAGGLTPSAVRWAFTAFYAANWHPVTWLSHMFDVQFFGMNAGAMHRVNVLLHLLNTLLLFGVLRRMTGAVWRSAFVAALFGVHPLHVESVAWISERKDVLSTLFLLLTIAAYAEWVRRRKMRMFAASLAACALGLMAKPMLVTAPALLLLLDFWPLGRLDGKREPGALHRVLLEKIPFVVLAAGAAAATWLAQSRARAIAQPAKFPAAQRVFNAFVAYASYLRDTFWPARLSVFYPHPSSMGDRVATAAWVGSAVGLAALTAMAIRASRRRPWIAFGWAWFVLSLGPVIGLIQVGSQSRADRYTYIPLIGIFVVIAWGAGEAVSAWRVPAGAVGAAAGACIAALTVAGHAQNEHWKDRVSLYTHAIEVTRANWAAWNNLGKYYLDSDLPRAIACFRRAIGFKEDYDIAWYNLGVAEGRLGRYGEAIASYRRSLDLDPSNADGWVNLSFAYQAVGNLDGAVAAAEEAYRIRPEDPAALDGALMNVVAVSASRGDVFRAARALDRIRAIDPRLAEEVARRWGMR